MHPVKAGHARRNALDEHAFKSDQLPHTYQNESNALFARGIATALPGGQLAHPEDHIEEEKEGKLRKNMREFKKMKKN